MSSCHSATVRNRTSPPSNVAPFIVFVFFFSNLLFIKAFTHTENQYEPFYLLIPSFEISIFIHGCETWSLTLKEECRLKVFENRILRRIFGPKRDENGEWKRLHNEELHSLYRSPN